MKLRTVLLIFWSFCIHLTLISQSLSPHWHALSMTYSPLENKSLQKSDFKNIYKIRTLDGSLNSLINPDHGAAHIKFDRLTSASYKEDGYSMLDRENPRIISNLLCHQTESAPSKRNLSSFVFNWLQFIDHDITITKEGEEYSPIKVPKGDDHFDPFNTGDQIIPFTRVGFDSKDNADSIMIREQINEISAWIDGSVVYGVDQSRAYWLRSFKYGKLKISSSSHGDLPPCNTLSGDCADFIDPDAPFMAGNIDQCGNPVKVFVLGDIRGNEQPGLTALHTLMIREHNRICDERVKAGMTDDEENYQYSRKIIGGLLQSITYNEVLPVLGLQLDPYDRWYRFESPNILNEFACAAYRLGHTMVTSDILFQNEKCASFTITSGCTDESRRMLGSDRCNQECSLRQFEGQIALRDVFFNPSIISNNGLEGIILGLKHQVQEEVDLHIVDDVRNFLFGAPGSGGLDLAAINIQRGRDHGIADFNQIRKELGLKPYTRFDQITSNYKIAEQLEELYGSIDNIDAWIGFLAEDHSTNSSLGPTLSEILKLQFEQIRKADRFWYERDKGLDEKVRQSLRDTRLADLINRNTDIEQINEVFLVSSCNQQPHTEYCSSSSRNSKKEWINVVQLGSHAYSSGDNSKGYSDLTDYSIAIEAYAGQKLSYKLRSKSKNYSTSPYWSAWIDFNQDQIFQPHEKVLERKGHSVHGYLQIHDQAESVTTRMRISMSKDRFVKACDIFEQGEVEDYSIRINTRNSKSRQVHLSQSTTSSEFKISPNPASLSQPLKVSFAITEGNTNRIDIYNDLGNNVFQQNIDLLSNTVYLDLQDLIPGHYFIVHTSGSEQTVKTMILIN